MSQYTQRFVSSLIKDNKKIYSCIFQTKFVFMINMSSYSKYLNYNEKKLMDKINEILKTMPYSIENGSLNSEYAVCQIFNMESIFQKLFEHVLEDTNDLKLDDISYGEYEKLSDELKKFYGQIHDLSLNLQLLYNHIFVEVKELYRNLRSEIEKTIINDSVLYRKLLHRYLSMEFNFFDTSYDNVCKIIIETLSLNNDIEKYNKIISYYDKRLEKTQEIWKSVEMEFFGIAYSPEIVKKTVWSEQEFNNYKNMLIC